MYRTKYGRISDNSTAIPLRRYLNPLVIYQEEKWRIHILQKKTGSFTEAG